MAADGRDAAGNRGTTVWLVVCRAAVLVAVLASTALYVHYLDPADSGFCGSHSGCEDVRRIGFSYFFSRFISVPLFGLVAYASVFVVSLVTPVGPALPALAGAGGVIAILLIAVQAFYVHAFCWLCTVVDASAIVAAVAALVHGRSVRSKDDGDPDPLPVWAWGSLLGVVVAVPLVWTVVKPAPPVPSVIRAEYLPDKINVIEFADFQCPFCRKLHPVLKHVMADYPTERVHFVRKQVPLEMHEQAKPAALAALCAEAQGKGEQLADRLVEIDLSPSADRQAAVGVGVDVEAFDRCLASGEPERRIAADRKLLDDAGMEGLPTTYVGGKRLLGAVPEAAIRDAFDRAARNEPGGGVPGNVYSGLAALVVAAVVWLGRSRRGIVKDGS